MKLFTDSDVEQHGAIDNAGQICCHRSELVSAPTAWQKRGLQQTASGYGSKLNSGLKINFNGKLYRLYITIWSNAGSTWFTAKGRKIFVH